MMSMLHIHKQKKTGRNAIFIMLAGALMLGGIYLLMLVTAPVTMPIIMQAKAIDVNTLDEPSDNRIIIPRIGVNIVYGEGEAALDRGAQWRYPERGNPEDGGNFIIAAHRFTIAPTPWETSAKSPFYNIDKLQIGDPILIDYDGIRYGYTINKIFDVKPDQVEIEAPSETPKLTLYSCSLGGSTDGRVVINAEPKGEVSEASITTSQTQ